MKLLKLDLKQIKILNASIFRKITNVIWETSVLTSSALLTLVVL